MQIGMETTSSFLRVLQAVLVASVEISPHSKRNPDTFNLVLLVFAKIKSISGFCFGIEVAKNSEGACVFCIAIIGGASPPI